MDKITEFTARLEEMRESRVCSAAEIDAAVFIFERLKTARSICARNFGDEPDQSAVLAVFSELCAEVRSGHSNTSRE